MGTELGVDIPLKSTFDPKGSDEAARKIRDLEQRLKGLGDSGDKAKFSVAGLASALGSLAVHAAVVQQIRESLMALAQQEQTLLALDRAANRFGHSAESVRARVNGFADSLKSVAGIDDALVLPALLKTYQATGDVEKAVTLARLAADLSIGGLMDYASAHNVVFKAANGQTEALKDLGISIDQTLGPQERARRGLVALEKQFGGSAQAAGGMRVEVNKLTEALEDIRDGAVQSLLDPLRVLGKVGLTVFLYLGEGAARLLEHIRGLGEGLGNLVAIGGLAASGKIDAVMARVDKMKGDWKTHNLALELISEEFAEKYRKLWSNSAEAVELHTGKAKDAVITNLNATEKKAQEAHDYELDRLRSEIEATVGADQAKAKLALAFYQLQKDLGESALLDKKGALDREVAIWETYRNKVRAIIMGVENDQAAANQRAADALLKLVQDAARRKKDQNDARAADAKETVDTEVKLEEERSRATMEGIGATLGFARQAFGETKEIQIAEAIISTYTAAAAALKAGPIVGPVLAAMITALGLANVAKIVSTRPQTRGRGFDNPENDTAARMGGARWANDMIREWSSGVSSGWAMGMARTNSSTVSNSSTVDQSRHYNLEFSLPGVLDVHSVEQGKQLRRTLDSVGRQVDDGRILSRRA